MTPNPAIMQAVEELGYRVTVGDVAAKAGLDINIAQQGLLVLAADARGHLQVSESGEIAYLFPQNFREVLRNKFLRLQLQEWWQKIWRILFYLIRISFGIVLVASIILIFLAITLIVFAINSSRDSNDSGGDGGGFAFFPFYWFSDWWWFLYWDYNDPYYRQQRQASENSEMNFLEAVFSFLFGDGNPNYNLEERRWQAIAATIRYHKGAIIAEQIAPYLDNLGQGYDREYEQYMLPVLARFDGRPEVSPEGQIVYHFPALQTTAGQPDSLPVLSYLRELLWRFSNATSGQILLAIGLGSVNLVGALILGNLLATSPAIAKLGGLVTFVSTLYPILLIYGIGFLTIPLIRYFWVQWRNGKITARNYQRESRVAQLNQPNSELRKKLDYARQFAAETVISNENLAYTTENDLIEQEVEQSAKIDAEWQRRLNQSGP